MSPSLLAVVMVSSAWSVSFSSVLVVSAHGSSPMIAWSVRASVSAIATPPVIPIFCTHCEVIVNVACEEGITVSRLKQAASAGHDAKVLALWTRGSKTFSCLRVHLLFALFQAPSSPKLRFFASTQTTTIYLVVCPLSCK